MVDVGGNGAVAAAAGAKRVMRRVILPPEAVAAGRVTVPMPVGARIFSLGVTPNGEPFLHVMFDSDETMQEARALWFVPSVGEVAGPLVAQLDTARLLGAFQMQQSNGQPVGVLVFEETDAPRLTLVGHGQRLGGVQ